MSVSSCAASEGQSSIVIWEAAYARFESPAEEVRKFRQRLQWFGAAGWPREWQIVDLFCGRGNGLVALEQLGFESIEGVDLSASLLAQYRGLANIQQADCQQLPQQDASRDLVTIHGGLHHLEQIPNDVDLVLSEVVRILRPAGMLALIEPWQTPFLSLVHRACGVGLLRRSWPKLDALATMIDHERTTYENWLRRPHQVRCSLETRFVPVRSRRRWGKLWFLGRKRE
jgi:ubiquinone/menaquinone biosynthesis C-methylase UbiE